MLPLLTGVANFAGFADLLASWLASLTLLARFDVDGGTFPRLPFEPISKEKYDELIEIQEISGETDEEFLATLNKYDSSEWSIESVAGCTNAACIAKAEADEREGRS